MFEVKDLGRNNRIHIPDSVIEHGHGQLVVSGSNCSISIGGGVKFRGLRMILSKQCHIEIGPHCVLAGEIVVKSENSCLAIGEYTTWMRVIVSFHEAGTITIGKDCMFSGDIRMDVSDMHSIIDVASGKRINPAEDIVIGDHVWVGQGVFITKGVNIGDDVIIGAKSVVSKNIPRNALVAGVPAKIIRDGVIWDRKRI